MKFKKITALFTAAAAALALVSCSSAVSIDSKTAADKLASSVAFSETLSEISSNVLVKKYGLDESAVTDAAGYCGTAAVVDEVAVFKTTDTAAVADAAQKHIQSQKDSYTSYAPNEVPKLDEAVIETVGDSVIVCVSNDSKGNVENVIAGLSE